MKKALFALSLLAMAAGAQAVVLHNNGEVANGANLSILTAPRIFFGFGVQFVSGNAVADNFTVGAGAPWTVESIDFFAYQTNATSFSLQTATWSVVQGDVNTGAVVASGTTALTDGGVIGHRVTDTTLTNTQRAIYRAQADVTDFNLAAGDYWLRWSLVGALASGPWQPPTSDQALGNAMQSLGNGSFATLFDANATPELPFVMYGQTAAVPEPSTYALTLLGILAVGAAVRRRQA
jgi:PEP-CTERM motif